MLTFVAVISLTRRNLTFVLPVVCINYSVCVFDIYTHLNDCKFVEFEFVTFQGMCFSLPTPDDPYNDRHGKKDLNKDTKAAPSKGSKREFPKEKSTSAPNGTLRDVGREKVLSSKEGSGDILTSGHLAKRSKTGPERTKVYANVKGGVQGFQEEDSESSISPSKFLILCLNAIENALYHDSIKRINKPLFADTWGIEF